MVPGCVVGIDRDRVARAADEPHDPGGVLLRDRNRDAVAVDAVAGDTDVVGRLAPLDCEPCLTPAGLVQVPGAVGATASTHGAVAARTDAVPDRFRAASNASTPTLYVVPHLRAESVYDLAVVLARRVPFR